MRQILCFVVIGTLGHAAAWAHGPAGRARAVSEADTRITAFAGSVFSFNQSPQTNGLASG